MKVCIAELREVANLLFDHLERSGHAEIELESDYYWSIPTEQLYSVYEEPTDLTIGQLSDDQRELANIRAGAKPPLAYALVWLSSLLRYVGARVVS